MGGNQAERVDVLVVGERSRRQTADLAHGRRGTSNGARRAQVDWGLLPEHQLSSEQERGRSAPSGVPVRVAMLPVEEILGTRTTGEIRGFMKALVDARRDDIPGFTMLGAEAGEVMAVVQRAMMAGLPYSTLRDAQAAKSYIHLG